MKEILAFLDVAEAEFKSYIATNALVAADKHSPSRRWHVDTVLSVLIKVCVFGVCCRCVCVGVGVGVGGGGGGGGGGCGWVCLPSPYVLFVLPCRQGDTCKKSWCTTS